MISLPRVLMVVFFTAACASVATAAGAPKRTSAPFDINKVHLDELMYAITCVPHEPETTSSSTPKDAIKNGDAALAQQHCQKAIADYQVAIDANPQDTSALWHQDIVAFALAGQTSDRKIALDIGEKAYHDADLAVTAQPANALFLVLRSDARLFLLPLHAATRSPLSLGRYTASERQNSYEDLTKAIAAAPTFAQAYAGRFLLDVERGDPEQANFDIGQARKYDPVVAQRAIAHQEAHDRAVAAYKADEERRSMAMSEAMMGLATAAGAEPPTIIYQPNH